MDIVFRDSPFSPCINIYRTALYGNAAFSIVELSAKKPYFKAYFKV